MFLYNGYKMVIVVFVVVDGWCCVTDCCCSMIDNVQHRGFVTLACVCLVACSDMCVFVACRLHSEPALCATVDFL